MHPADLQTHAVRATLEALRFDVDSYDLGWQDYLTCGGFPRAVAEHARVGAVSIPYLRDLASWLRSDIDPEAAPESIPVLLAGLTQRASGPLNASRAAAALGYSNRQVFERRLRRMVDTFAALECPQRDDQGDAVPSSQSKVYLTDPLLAWLPGRLRAGLPEPDMTTLTEMVLGVLLARAVDHRDEGRWVANDTIGHLRTGTGNEIDFAPVPVPTASATARTAPIESKWIDSGWRSAVKVMESRYDAGILATKSLLDLDHPAWAVPAPLVALLLA